MKNKKIFLVLTLVTILMGITIFCFFTKNDYKNSNIGNNSIKSAEDIKNYILNISSYEAKINVEINSNKNSNKYIIEQKFSSPNICMQKVLQPDNISGLTTTYDGSSLKIEDTNINLSKIYENYPYVADNMLSLGDFIENYKSDNKALLNEEDSEIIMETKIQNKYIANKKLYIDKKTAKPTKLVIQDINKKTIVYILYSEIKINNLNKEDALAFKLKVELENI